MAGNAAEQQRTEQFLDLYRRLETVAESIVGKSGRGSTVLTLASKPRFAPYRSELDCCREVRNLLSHEVRIDGSFAVTPSPATIAFLEKIIALAEDPPLALTRATRTDSILSAKPEDKVLTLTRSMRSRGFSHVPILENGAVKGVFSESVISQALLKSKKLQISEETRLKAFASWTEIHRHLGRTYQFLPRTATVDDAVTAFDSAYSRKKKLKILFITETGNVEEPILGLLSPYDVLKR